MGLMVNTNTTSMASQRHLAQNTKSLQTSFERLSSGLRINSAADDAAGMTIATKLTAQVKGLNQAARNVNDTTSMLKTAESALTETGNLLQRLRELSVQAGNDTNTSADRAALQGEVKQILEEVDRIADDVEYNGQNLTDGTFNAKSFQIGANAGQTISVDINSAKTTELGKQSVVEGDLAAAGRAGVGQVLNTTNANNAFTNDQFTVASADGDAALIQATSDSSDSVSFRDKDSSAIAKAAAFNAISAVTGVSAEAEAGTFTGLVAVVGSAGSADINDNSLTINGVGITFSTGSLVTQAADADGKVQAAINAKTASHGVVASLGTGGDAGKIILTAVDGRNISVVEDALAQANTGMTNAALTEETVGGKLKLTADSEITVSGAAALSAMGITAAAATGVDTGSSVIADMALTSASDAEDALATVDVALAQVAKSRASIGARLNRLDSASTTLATQAENMSSARSQIQDVDFATETASFSKNQILQQASSSMLAQANVSGQLALSLLGFG